MDLLCCANFLLSRAMRRAVAFGSLDKALDTADGPKPRQRAAGKGPLADHSQPVERCHAHQDSGFFSGSGSASCSAIVARASMDRTHAAPATSSAVQVQAVRPDIMRCSSPSACVRP